MRGFQGIASQGIDRRSLVGTRRSSIRKNASTEIEVVPSMLTALLHPRITFAALSDPDRTGAPKSSSSEANREKSSLVGVLLCRQVARTTSSITGQSTPCAGLSALALPYQVPASDWRKVSSSRPRETPE